MVNYITSITVLTYGLGPIVLLVLRRNQPALRRPFRLWGANFSRRSASSAATGSSTGPVSKPTLSFHPGRIGFVLYAGYYHLVARMPAQDFGWRYIAWLLPWFGGMWVLSAIGDVGGGFGRLRFWPGVIAVAIWSLIVIEVALRSALPAAETAEMMVRMEKTR